MISPPIDDRPKAKLKMMAEVGEELSKIKMGTTDNLQAFVKAGMVTCPGMFSTHMDANQETWMHSMHLLHLAYRWALGGRPAYQLTHSLAAALMLTEPPKMQEGEFLELPTPAFVIIPPTGLIPMFNQQGQGWADLIWVHQFKGLHRKTNKVETFVRWITEWCSTSVWRDRRPDQLYDKDERIYVLFPDREVIPQAEDDISMNGSLRLVRNLCSWLEATGELDQVEEAQSPRRRKKRKAAKDKGPRARVIQLGRGVKLGPELRKMASEVALGTSRNSVEGWQLRTQHIVQGHWKMQPYGEGRKLRKRIWIEPYWRGPEGEEAWNEVLSAEGGRA